MLEKIGLLIIALTCFTSVANAQDVQQGANEYDWRACVSAKQSDCLSDCTNSEEISCSDDCDQLAADKCQSQGLTPPAD